MSSVLNYPLFPPLVRYLISRLFEVSRWILSPEIHDPEQLPLHPACARGSREQLGESSCAGNRGKADPQPHGTKLCSPSCTAQQSLQLQ